MLAPAVLTEQVTGDIPVQSLGIGSAVLNLAGSAPEAASVDAHRYAGCAVAALGLDRYGAAKGVKTEERIRSGHQRDFGDGDLGNQVPGHDVAKWLVLPDAVHVH